MDSLNSEDSVSTTELQLLQAKRLFHKGNYVECQKACLQMYKKQPDNLSILFLLSNNYFMQENYISTIESLTLLLRYKPDLLKAHILYGQTMNKLNKFKEALSSFQKAIQLDPKETESWIGMGHSFSLNKQFNTAIIFYQKALDLNKSLINPHMNIGFMYFELKQYDKSILFLETAIQMNPPESYQLLPILAQAYLFNENVESAMQIHSLYLTHKPNDPMVLYEMGRIHYNIFHNAADAERYFKLCVDLDERNVLYKKCLAAVYRQLGKDDLANALQDEI